MVIKRRKKYGVFNKWILVGVTAAVAFRTNATGNFSKTTIYSRVGYHFDDFIKEYL
jgi:hypothetical protein